MVQGSDRELSNKTLFVWGASSTAAPMRGYNLDMSIHRSGLVKAVYVVCTSRLDVDGILLEVGQKYELIHDIGSMYIVRGPNGRELVAPKGIFKPDDGETKA